MTKGQEFSPWPCRWTSIHSRTSHSLARSLTSSQEHVPLLPGRCLWLTVLPCGPGTRAAVPVWVLSAASLSSAPRGGAQQSVSQTTSENLQRPQQGSRQKRNQDSDPLWEKLTWILSFFPWKDLKININSRPSSWVTARWKIRYFFWAMPMLYFNGMFYFSVWANPISPGTTESNVHLEKFLRFGHHHTSIPWKEYRDFCLKVTF